MIKLCAYKNNSEIEENLLTEGKESSIEVAVGASQLGTPDDDAAIPVRLNHRHKERLYNIYKYTHIHTYINTF